MRVYPEKLAQELKQRLQPVYLISGDETLLVQESVDLVRRAARYHGCSERHVLDASDRAFGWQDLLQDASSMSLFAEQRLIELRIPNGKPGTEGSKALCEYLESPPENDTLLIVSGKIDRASTNSKWYKAIDKLGVTVQLWPVSAGELPRWLEQRARQIELPIDRDALELLAERVEGNLLAAVQELGQAQGLAHDVPANHLVSRPRQVARAEHQVEAAQDRRCPVVDGSAIWQVRDVLHIPQAPFQAHQALSNGSPWAQQNRGNVPGCERGTEI